MMPTSSDVTLRKRPKAHFPEGCIRCGEPNRGAHLRLSTNKLTWWLILGKNRGARVHVPVPACRKCMPALKRQRFLRPAVSSVVGFALAMYAVFGLQVVSEPFQKAAAGATFLLAQVLMHLIWSRFPVPVDITAYKDKLTYQFADPELADEFAELNQADLIG